MRSRSPVLVVLTLTMVACSSAAQPPSATRQSEAAPTANPTPTVAPTTPAPVAASYFERDLPEGLTWGPAGEDLDAEALTTLDSLDPDAVTGVEVRSVMHDEGPVAVVIAYSLSPDWAEGADAEELASSLAQQAGQELPPGEEIQGRTVWVISDGDNGVAVWLDGRYWVYLVTYSSVAADGMVDLILGHGAQSSSEPRTAGNSCPEVSTPHQDEELEALLPARVAGRVLTRWSIKGACLFQFHNSDPESGELAEAEARELGVDVDSLGHAIAGRTDIAVDPPYFVHVMRAPKAQLAFSLAFVMFTTRIGYLDPMGVTDADYEVRSIGGRDVMVGTPDMLVQDEHQRGLPYLYDTGDLVFIVVTDDEAWAADAIGQLP